MVLQLCYNLRTGVNNKKTASTYNYVGGFFMFGESFFNKVEKKTNVNKETIMSLASKVQHSNMKDEKVLRDLIKEIGEITGREVSEEKTKKIINAVVQDNIPKNLDEML